MNRLLRPSLLAGAAALVAGVAVPTKARAGVEVGGTAGIHVFSDTNELGVADTPSAESERNSALFGLRLSRLLFRRHRADPTSPGRPA